MAILSAEPSETGQSRHAPLTKDELIHICFDAECCSESELEPILRKVRQDKERDVR